MLNVPNQRKIVKMHIKQNCDASGQCTFKRKKFKAKIKAFINNNLIYLLMLIYYLKINI